MAKTVHVLACVILFSFSSCKRADSELDKRSQTLQFLHDNNLLLKQLRRSGFELHVNCDSALFLKGMFGDTTKIWTPSTLSMFEVDELNENIGKNKFGNSQYINSVAEDGRVELVDMQETTFIKRNDSLYQMSRFIKPKLIFHPKMFSNGRNAIKVDKKFNYKADSVLLEREWIRNDLKHYHITIKNQEAIGPTAYSFSFDQNLKFIAWENCEDRREKSTPLSRNQQ
jgi:hypothetical protein